MQQGHNNPPSMIEAAGETTKDISDWMAENPVIQSEESAREAKVFIDRGKLCLKDLDDERDGKVRPLNEQVKEINASYKPARETLTTLVGLLGIRVVKFMRDERERREKIAQEAARVAAEAEQRAREAERVEQENIASANSGELGVYLAASTEAANQAFRDFEVALRQALIAEKETHVKIGGGFTRALGLKKKESLSVTNGELALRSVGLTDEIAEAICKAARAYRKLHGTLPDGVESTITEGV